MDSVYKYGYCHRYRPGRETMKKDHTPEHLEVSQQGPDRWATNWIPSDNRDNWNNRKYLAEKLGWTDKNVKYKFNAYGFRHTGEFVENRNALVALGCSLTFGVGVNYDQTWPYYVAKELGLDCINLAQPGTGINASYRVAKMWLPVIKPKVVMFYVPNHHRRELWPRPEDNLYLEQGVTDKDTPVSIGPWTKGLYEDYFKLLSAKRETDIWREAYLDAMRWIARDSKYIHFPATQQTAGRRESQSSIDDINDKVITTEMHNQIHKGRNKLKVVHSLDKLTPYWNTHDARWARDMVHPGPRVMRDNIAPLFTGAYRGWNKEQIDAWRKDKL